MHLVESTNLEWQSVNDKVLRASAVFLAPPELCAQRLDVVRQPFLRAIYFAVCSGR